MLDIITPVTATIRHLISTGSAEQQLLAKVATAFPQLSPTHLSVALQVAQTQAKQRAARRH